MQEAQPAPSFGRYKDPVMLGAGGMGAVYRAVDPSLDRYVAIKVLTQREPRYVERFRREAQVLAKIMHPSIIQIYEIVGSDEDASDPYIVMEYFEGKPLDTLVKQGPLSAFQVVNILRQSAEGLKKAHANNVIHRDIKPANIMVSEVGDVKILDFGIAKLRDAKKDLTGNTVLGTPYYMSPEQAMGQPIDARTDIYSLGITAFHLLTGKKPFEARSKVDVMLMQVKTPLPRIHDLVPCDDRVVRIVEKMCAKASAERYQSCDELIEALDGLPRALGGRQVHDTEPEVPRVAPRRPAQAAPAQPAPTPVRREQTPTARQPQRTPSRPSHPRPSSRPDVRRSPPQAVPKARARTWLFAGGGAAAGLVVLGIVAFALSRGGNSAPTGPFRVPATGWSSAGAVKKVHAPGSYGNCVFSTREIERGREDAGALRTTFSAGDPIYGRCYFARGLGTTRPGEVWQELWIDGVKRAQIIYDPALPPDEDQIALEVTRRHGSRLSDLPAGKHTVDIWIYRQTDDAEKPRPLSGGELVVRR